MNSPAHADLLSDAVLGASAATDPTYRVGDERYTFDRIGNMRNVQRHGTFTATPAGVVMFQLITLAS